MAAMTTMKPKAARVESVDARRLRAAARVSARRLTETERAELAYLWGGYESAIGCTSTHGACETRLLRAPPRDVRVYVMDELVSVGKPVERESLVRRVAVQGWATVHEVRRAVGSLVGSGHLGVDLQDGTRVRKLLDANGDEKIVEEVILVENVRIVGSLDPKVPLPRTSAERWARADAELETFCLGGPVCKDEGGATVDPRDATPRPSACQAALARLKPVERRTLERAYGSGPRAAYADVFGPDLAAIVPLTPAAERARVAVVSSRVTRGLARLRQQRADWVHLRALCLEAARNGWMVPEHEWSLACTKPLPLDEFAAAGEIADGVTTTEAMRAVLDARPKERAPHAAWVAARKAFIRDAANEAERMLGDACVAYRAARRGGA